MESAADIATRSAREVDNRVANVIHWAKSPYHNKIPKSSLKFQK